MYKRQPIQSVVHNHAREPHTTHTTPNMDMDNEIESIDNQSEEVAVAAAATAASIMIGLIEQEAEDEDCAGAHGEEEEEEPKAKQRRRSYPRPKYMESAWGQWLRKLEELHASKGGLDEDCREARQFVVAFRVPTRCSSASSRPWRLHFQLQHTTSMAGSTFPCN